MMPTSTLPEYVEKIARHLVTGGIANYQSATSPYPGMGIIQAFSGGFGVGSIERIHEGHGS
jgi:hypothetical protein